MPNWCKNTQVIMGPKSEVYKLYELLKKWTKKTYMPNGFEEKGLSNIVACAGLKRKDEDIENGVECRGMVITDFTYKEDNENSKLYFETETAWKPMPEMWYKILEKYAPNCEYLYCSEEPSMGIYESNDVERKIFKDEYFVDTWYDDDEKSELQKYFPDTGYEYKAEDIKKGIQKTLQTTEIDMEELIERFNRLMMEQDGPVRIHELKYKKE